MNERRPVPAPDRREGATERRSPLVRLVELPKDTPSPLPDKGNLIGYLSQINTAGESAEVRWSGRGSNVSFMTSLGRPGKPEPIWPPKSKVETVDDAQLEAEDAKYKRWITLKLNIVSPGDFIDLERNWLDKTAFGPLNTDMTIQIRGVSPVKTDTLDEVGSAKREQYTKFAGISADETNLVKRTQRESAKRIYDEYNSSQGVWQPEIVIGIDSDDELEVTAAARLVAATLSHDKYAFTPSGSSASTKEQALAQHNDDIIRHGKTFISTEGFADFFRLPTDKLQGIDTVIVPDYHVSTGVKVQAEKAIGVGRILDNTGDINSGEDAGEYVVSIDDLMNVVIAGATRSGKTEAGLVLMEELAKKGVTGTIFAPKAGFQWRMWAARLAENPDIPEAQREVTYIKISEPENPNHLSVGVNIFQPADGYSVISHAQRVIDNIVDLYKGGENAAEAQSLISDCLTSAVLGRTITKIEDGQVTKSKKYVGALEEHGFNKEGKFTGNPEDRTYPTITEVMEKAVGFVEALAYGKSGETRNEVQSFLQRALTDLQSTDFFQAKYTLKPDELLKRNTIIDMEGLNDNVKGLIMSSVSLIQEEQATAEQIESGDGRPRKLSHANYIGEGGLLFGAGKKTEATIGDLFAQTLKLGITNLIEVQNLCDLSENVLNNAHGVFIGRLETGKERDLAAAKLKMFDNQKQKDDIGYLGQGVMLAKTFNQTHPVRITTPNPEFRPSSTTEVVDAHAGLINAGPTNELFTVTEMSDAKAELNLQFTGGMLGLWADLEILSHIYNLGPITAGEFESTERNPFGIFRNMAADPGSRKVLMAMIEEAVTSQVLARETEIRKLPNISTKDIITQVTASLVAHAQGQAYERPFDPDNVPPAHRYNQIARELTSFIDEGPGDQMVHPNTDSYEQTYGHSIPGQTAAEQLHWVNQWSAIIRTITLRDSRYMKPREKADFTKLADGSTYSDKINELLQDVPEHKRQAFETFIDDLKFQSKKVDKERMIVPVIIRGDERTSPIDFATHDDEPTYLKSVDTVTKQVLAANEEDLSADNISDPAERRKAVAEALNKYWTTKNEEMKDWSDIAAEYLGWFTMDQFTENELRDLFTDLLHDKLTDTINHSLPVEVFTSETRKTPNGLSQEARPAIA